MLSTLYVHAIYVGIQIYARINAFEILWLLLTQKVWFYNGKISFFVLIFFFKKINFKRSNYNTNVF